MSETEAETTGGEGAQDTPEGTDAGEAGGEESTPDAAPDEG